MIWLADNDCADLIAWMRMLIWAFAVRICSKTHFRMARSIYDQPYTKQKMDKGDTNSFIHL